MHFGVQFVTVRSIPVREGDFFSCEVLVNGNVEEGASGLDQYALNTIILPGKRITSSGRSYTYSERDLICGLGHLEARPFSYCELKTPLTSLELRLQTNRLLDYRELPVLLELEIWWSTEDHEHSRRLSLHNPFLRTDWEERGSYRLDLTDLARDLFTNVHSAPPI